MVENRNYMAPKRRRQTENPPYVENSRDQAIIRSLEAMTEMFRSLVPIRIRIKTKTSYFEIPESPQLLQLIWVWKPISHPSIG